MNKKQLSERDICTKFITPPLAMIEAKDNNHAVDAGMQQALGYAETLQIPVVIKAMAFSLPPLAEQRRIVAKGGRTHGGARRLQSRAHHRPPPRHVSQSLFFCVTK